MRARLVPLVVGLAIFLSDAASAQWLNYPTPGIPRTADGKPNGDWTLEQGMVAPMHLLYPGGERERWRLEEVVVIGKDGGRPLFSWGFGPLTGA